jgi:ubiquitin carboxyl-terminal hydrolase 6/32
MSVLQEIMDLEKRFWHLVGSSTSGRIDYAILSSLVSPPLPEALVPGLFRAFDENQVRLISK